MDLTLFKYLAIKSLILNRFLKNKPFSKTADNALFNGTIYSLVGSLNAELEVSKAESRFWRTLYKQRRQG